MDKKKDISMAVIKRLPKYYRHLAELLRNDVDRVSSKELSEKIGFTASQIRQDFNCFGGFGQQGYGYNVSELKKELIKILGLDKRYNLIVIGAGNMGQALANYVAFEKESFYIRALFDINPKLIGMTIRDIKIYDLDYLEEYIKMNPTDIAVITTPRQEAQAIADRLVTSGIKGIWNFAAVDIEVPQDVVVENAHISDSLFTLSFKTREDIKLI